MLQNIYENMMQIENFNTNTTLDVFGFTLMASLIIAFYRCGSKRGTVSSSAAKQNRYPTGK